jgi:adenylyl-sulfate kinase
VQQSKNSSKYKLNKGCTLWLTGLSGAGKSTLTEALAKEFAGIELEVLDGDELRAHLSRDLGFSREDRFTNIERIAFMAGKISKHNVIVLVPVIAPYKEARAMARSLSDNYIEVYVKADLETVKTRDVKGLYKKALNNEIKNFTGVSDPYEAPENPEITVETDKNTIDECVKTIISYLVKNSYIVENL